MLIAVQQGARTAQLSPNFIDEIFSKYGGVMYKIAYEITKQQDWAEDVVQLTLVKLWKARQNFDEIKSKLITWVINITKNTAIDAVRSKAYRNRQINDPIGDYRIDNQLEADSQNLEYIGFKKMVMEGLDARDKKIIDLFYFEGCTQKQVAERLNMSVGSVKTRLRVSVSTLRGYLNPEDYYS